MKLSRSFDWTNDDTVYVRVDEDEVSRGNKPGMIAFTAKSVDGKVFEGQAFETTVARMCDNAYWKLELNPKSGRMNIVAAERS